MMISDAAQMVMKATTMVHRKYQMSALLPEPIQLTSSFVNSRGVARR